MLTHNVTTNTDPDNDAVLFAFASTTPAAPDWLSLGTKTQMYDPWDIIENQAELTGTVPENLIVKETYTFKVRAYEESVMSEEATTAQYNDKTFIYTVLANPSCMSPASNKICP